MKKILLSFSIIASLGAIAQVQETVSLNAGYSDQLWYKLDDGTTSSDDLSNYHIAFQTSNMGTGVLFNSAIGTLYKASEDTTEFLSINTANYSSWETFINSDTSWSVGAFNKDDDGMFDIGWGDYDMTTHYVNGDQFYLVELNSGETFKLLISRLANSVYTVRIASLDNSIDTYIAIDKTNYSDKSLVYLDLNSQAVVDREPLITEWDFLFTKYTDNTINYGVAGVLHNPNVAIAQYDGVDPLTHSEDGTVAFSSQINTIGYDWKSFNGTSYDVVSDRVYYVKDVNGDYWKVIFTGTTGSSSGEFSFTKEKIAFASTENEDLQLFKLYPNPVNNVLNMVVDNNTEAVVTILNTAGKVVFSKHIKTGFTKHKIDVSAFNKGVYLVQIVDVNGNKSIQKIVK